MKLAPVSGDMLIKLALGVAVLGAVGLMVWKAKSAASGAVDAVKDAAGKVAEAVNPASDQNLVYRGASAITEHLPGAVPGETVGTYAYGITESLGNWWDSITGHSTTEQQKPQPDYPNDRYYDILTGIPLY